MTKQIQFLADIHRNATVDKWGWTRHEIGRYTLCTNGVAWTATVTATRRRASLAAVIKAEGQKVSSLNHKDMTKHIRGRLKAAKIPARVRLYTACGVRVIQVDRVTHDSAWTAKQAQEICLIASVNNLTKAGRSAIDYSDAYWTQVPEWRGQFNFEFHGA